MSRHTKPKHRILPRRGKPVSNRGSMDLAQLQRELNRTQTYTMEATAR